MIAVGHKMMGVVYSVISNDTPYKDPGIDYEKLMVKKNAPRWIRALKKYDFM